MSLLALLASSTDGTPVEPDVPVTATAPTADDTANTITIPTVTGVVYQVDGATVTGTLDVGDVTTTITVNAVALAGYVLTGTTSWTFTFTGSAALVNLYPTATPQAVPTPIAHWDFREAAPPYYTTAATGGDLPLAAKTTAPVKTTSEVGDAIWLDGSQTLTIEAENLGRLNIGGNSGTQVSVAAWVYVAKSGQVAVAGIWGEFADPPQRQYALFYDLPAYGGADMSCFHVSKDGGPTPGYPYSTDYSATQPEVELGRWHLMVGTYDGVQAVSYIDGVANARSTAWTRTGDGKRNPYTFTDGLNGNPHEFAVSTGAPLPGMIRDVRVWDTALTPGQVLTLAAEHAPLGPPEPEVAWVMTDQQEHQAADDTQVFNTWTFTMDAGTPSADRVLVAAIGHRGYYSSMPTLTGVTIGGVPATLVMTAGNTGECFAYAVVPTGATADVVLTWSASGTQAARVNVHLIALDGAATTHAGAVTSFTTKSVLVPAATRGGIILGLGRTNADNTAAWTPGTTVTQSRDNPDGQFGVTLGVATATGHPYPWNVVQGTVGINLNWVSAIAFDPA